MLKFEGIAVGTKIRAYDFEPFPGRTDRYVTGTILRNEWKDGAKFYVINCREDSAFGSEHGRVGLLVYVPMETCMDFDKRITELEQ